MPVSSPVTLFADRYDQVELLLQKSDGKMWTILEKTDRDLGGIALTFGVGGRTGTVGGKEIIR